MNTYLPEGIKLENIFLAFNILTFGFGESLPSTPRLKEDDAFIPSVNWFLPDSVQTIFFRTRMKSYASCLVGLMSCAKRARKLSSWKLCSIKHHLSAEFPCARAAQYKNRNCFCPNKNDRLLLFWARKWQKRRTSDQATLDLFRQLLIAILKNRERK